MGFHAWSYLKMDLAREDFASESPGKDAASSSIARSEHGPAWKARKKRTRNTGLGISWDVQVVQAIFEFGPIILWFNLVYVFRYLIVYLIYLVSNPNPQYLRVWLMIANGCCKMTDDPVHLSTNRAHPHRLWRAYPGRLGGWEQNSRCSYCQHMSTLPRNHQKS